jgi:hypothetical protein
MSTAKEVQDALYSLAEECGYEFALGTAVALLNGTLRSATATERSDVVEIINTNRKAFKRFPQNCETQFGRPG